MSESNRIIGWFFTWDYYYKVLKKEKLIYFLLHELQSISFNIIIVRRYFDVHELGVGGIGAELKFIILYLSVIHENLYIRVEQC